MKWVDLGPAYSEADHERLRLLREQLRALQRDYQAAANPIIARIVEIENCYPRRQVVVPDAPDPA